MSSQLSTSSNELPIFIRLLPPAVRPLVDAPLRKPRLWMGLAWMDIVQSYRRTMLGPLWITLNLIIFTAAMTLVYGALFAAPTREYAAYLLCGMIVWLWISALLTEVGNTFISNSQMLKSTTIDKSVYIWAAVHRQVIILAHHLVIYAALVVLHVIQFTVYTLLAVPAIAILYLLSIPVTAIASILFCRYRDLPRLVGSSIVVMMMITPIFWQANMITGWKSAIVHFNPFYHLIEFVRAPLLGQLPDTISIWVVMGMTAGFWILGSVLYRRYEKYVVFWL